MSSDNKSSDPVDSIIQSPSLQASDRQLRLFGCACCERLLKVFSEPMLSRLIEFGRRRCREPLAERDRDSLREESTRLYDSLYPGHGAPAAIVSALSACGSVAFTESARLAATNSGRFAADAIAAVAANTVEDDDYDTEFAATYAAEQEAQALLWSDEA